MHHMPMDLTARSAGETSHQFLVPPAMETRVNLIYFCLFAI